MRLITTNTVKHIYAEFGILTVYGLFTFETINYVKQFNNARLLKRQKTIIHVVIKELRGTIYNCFKKNTIYYMN